VPFYVYEFIGRSGYAVPIPVIERLRTEAPNLRGLKVSDTPWSAVEPYLLDRLDVFVGLEPLVLEGMEAGAAGAVSGLATAFPETVANLVHDRSGAAHDRVVSLRDALQGIPFISSMKHLLARRGIIVDPCVRAPLRSLTDAERETVGTLL
jgi:dihydrodipicolinate synthase/N-acetylneuraminate lyase